jgi:DNA (cytosine-5)-methyltransferase 1
VDGDGVATRRKLRVAGLFAGIGGIELGLHGSGHSTELLCEIDPHAAKVLAAHFPGTPLVSDVRDIQALPAVDLVAAGFPCQDLSQAGRTAGISGGRSGLVGEVFRLIETPTPRWLLLENVSFMLHLDRGEGMRFLTSELERLGMRWAYRVVDSRAFGLPQRRQRVILLASKVADPGPLLFEQESGSAAEPTTYAGTANGFYWTEGLTGLGWAVDGTPTLKGGSTIGIPSPPAIWLPNGQIGTPEIRDAERLQGFPTDWTLPGVKGEVRQGPRWRMVGNAVSVPVAQWVGDRLASEPSHADYTAVELPDGFRWPKAAEGGPGRRPAAVGVSMWPIRTVRRHLADFLEHPLAPLSIRACDGFLSRAARSSLNFPPGLLDAVRAHRERLAAARMPLAS